jgi:lipopolysaccharide biosynthesis glycosyltransferase
MSCVENEQNTANDLSDTIQVALAFHDSSGNYAINAGVTLTSLFINTKKTVNVHILRDQSLTADNQCKLETIATQYGQKLQFIDVELPDEWEKICTSNLVARSLTRGVFYRLLLPEKLSHLKKVIYLDCDVIIDMDIQELWDLNLDGKPLAASFDWQRENDRYFNSGVMVLALDILRENYELISRVVQFFNLYPNSVYPDQDFLNWLIKGDFLPIDTKFNILVNQDNVENFKSGHRIIHFAGTKPWDDFKESHGLEYWRYLLLTPWGQSAVKSLYTIGLKTKEKADKMIKHTQEYYANFVNTMSTTTLEERVKILLAYIAQVTGLKVVKGPFRGMLWAINSSLGPGSTCARLLGTYEEELHPILSTITKTAYRWVIDIGCAEGYYSIGLASAMPTTKVIAFDINENARQACRSLAELNGVSERIEIKAACTPQALKPVLEMITQAEDHSFIKIDVEGYEYELLDPEVIPALKLCDILVECHDFARPNLTPILLERFAKTHDISIIKQAGRNPLEFSFLEPLSDLDRWLIINEGRAVAMHWLFCKAIRN